MRTILLSFFLLIALSAHSQIFKTYTAGFYTTTSGDNIYGLVNRGIYDDFFRFKKDSNAKVEKIKLGGISSVSRINKDTILAMTENGDSNKAYFGLLSVETPTAKIYRKFNSLSGGEDGGSVTSFSLGSMGNHTVVTSHTVYSRPTYRKWAGTEKDNIMYEKDGTTFEVNKKNFKEILSNAFADYPELASGIADGNYKFKDAWDLIRDYKQYKAEKTTK
jgi:hypothetical protein